MTNIITLFRILFVTPRHFSLSFSTCLSLSASLISLFSILSLHTNIISTHHTTHLYFCIFLSSSLSHSLSQWTPPTPCGWDSRQPCRGRYGISLRRMQEHSKVRKGIVTAHIHCFVIFNMLSLICYFNIIFLLCVIFTSLLLPLDSYSSSLPFFLFSLFIFCPVYDNHT